MRDLIDSLKKEWDGSKNDSDFDILYIYDDLGDINFFDASTSKERMNETCRHKHTHHQSCSLHYFLVCIS